MLVIHPAIVVATAIESRAGCIDGSACNRAEHLPAEIAVGAMLCTFSASVSLRVRNGGIVCDPAFTKLFVEIQTVPACLLLG